MTIYVYGKLLNDNVDIPLEMSTNMQDVERSYNMTKEYYIKRHKQQEFERHYYIQEIEINNDTGIFWETDI